MPHKGPRICACGNAVPAGQRCACQAARDTERKARHDATRPSARARGYDTKWERERKKFLEANPKCVLCGAPATVVDHIEPHKRDWRLFWNRRNWQPLCAHCHNSRKQRQERKRIAEAA